MPSVAQLRAAVAACLLAVTLAAPAAADSRPLVLSGPADGAQLTAGSAVALHAQGVSGDTGMELRISVSPQRIDACGRIAGDVARSAGVPVGPGRLFFDFPTGPWYERPGTYYWQVHRAAADGSCTATAVRRLVLSPAPAGRPDLATLPALSREPIPSWIGRSNGAGYVIRSSGLPAAVPRSRFVTLVRNGGRRWRLTFNGTRAGRPRFGNGRSEVGFSTRQVPRHALGVTITGPAFRDGRRVTERDLILRADLPWQPGPTHPSRREIDLETVILHELGHVAGIRGHVSRGCHNTPMVVGLGGGEWWRSTTDFSFRACAGRGA